MYDVIDINEMAFAVYNATIDKSKRQEVEKSFGKGLKQCWNQLNEMCIELRKYYKVKKSNRKEILTTLDKFFAYELPLSIDFLDFVDSKQDKPREESSAGTATGTATVSCEENPGNSTVYDIQWLYVFIQSKMVML